MFSSVWTTSEAPNHASKALAHSFSPKKNAVMCVAVINKQISGKKKKLSSSETCCVALKDNRKLII